MNILRVMDYKAHTGEATKIVATEAVNDFSTSAENPMKIDIVTDKFIEQNVELYNIVPVTNPVSRERGGVFTSDGIFSPFIFGVTQDEKKSRFSYIDLHCQVFHPYIFEILVKIMRPALRIARGEGSWTINKEGQPVELMQDDPKYDPDATGIQWLIDNWNKLEFKRNSSKIRDQRVKLIASYKKEDIVISKWLVIPVFYREIQMTNGIPTTPDLDKWYVDLIRYSNSLTKASFSWNNNNTKFRIQQTLLEIRKYGQTLVEGKHGYLKHAVIGKSVDYGYRSVISCVAMDTYDKPEDNPIDIYSSGIPLAQCCVTGFPFIKTAVQEWLRQQFESYGSRFPAYNEKTGKVELIRLEDPMSKFTETYIKHKIDNWIETPGARFRPVHVPTEHGEMSFVYPGHTKYNAPGLKGPDQRIFTWTDLLYICAYDVLKDKHVYITRYPISDYFGTFPSRVHVLSTLKTCEMQLNDTLYKDYPVIDPTLPEDVVATLFNDTITMAIVYLAGLQGDFDGDQVSLKMVYTQEANAEAEKLLHSAKHYLREDGSLVRECKNETYMTFYNMTKDED